MISKMKEKFKKKIKKKITRRLNDCRSFSVEYKETGRDWRGFSHRVHRHFLSLLLPGKEKICLLFVNMQNMYVCDVLVCFFLRIVRELEIGGRDS
jgi:hypothetical protein